MSTKPSKINLIYIELRRRGLNIYFLKKNVEIDFYVPEKNLLIQSSYSILDPETKIRETKALKKGMNEFKINEGYIITFNEEGEIKTDEGTIFVIPAWKWLLT